MITYTCTHCDGEGRVPAIVCGTGYGCQPRLMRCFHCHGSGQRTQDAIDREAEGELLRSARRGLQITLRDAAKILGIDAAAYSALEWGKDETDVDAIRLAKAQLERRSAGRAGSDG